MCEKKNEKKRPRPIAVAELGHNERHLIVSLVKAFVRKTKEGDVKQRPGEEVI